MSSTTSVPRPPALAPPGEEAAESPALAALAGFAQSMVPPLLILALSEAGREAEAPAALRQLASTLRELQAVAAARGGNPALCGSAIRRLFGTLPQE